MNPNVNNLERLFMFYICYDMHDNLICFLNDIEELVLFTGLRKYDINYKFKNSLTNYIVALVNDKKYKFYRYE